MIPILFASVGGDQIVPIVSETIIVAELVLLLDSPVLTLELDKVD